ncbi:MAG: ABC transporter permease [Cyclobacteriaceae bacterium]|nr:ABC transporter permease [Cyclobacteriaceae bacterium]
MEYEIKIKKKTKHIFNDKWVWKMAWKDARGNFSRLFLFISSIVIGIAALVAISSFNINLQKDINLQAKELLGADFVIHTNKGLEEQIVVEIDSIKHPKASDASLASMVSFMTSTSGVRLVRVVGIEGDFPFYGNIETTPDNAYELIKSGDFAMVDANLATQFDVSADDSIKIGKLTFKIAGEVKKIPGGGGVQSTFTPSVYITKQMLDSTGLIQFGSRVNYNTYFKTNTEKEAKALENRFKPLLKKYGHTYETVDGRKKNLGRALQNLYRFFNLLAFVALILGCIGVASSVHIYVKEKRSTVGMLRCVGASGLQTFNIFFIQAVGLGVIGSAIGVMLGLIFQFAVPLVLQEFVPIEIKMGIAWVAVFQGLGLGIIIAILFSMLPLISIRFIPPLVVLRTSMESLDRRSKLRALMIVLIILFPLLFASLLTNSWMTGAAFFGALLVAFFALWLLAKALVFLIKRFFPHKWSFVWRQSLSNLFRPNNQTLVLVVVIGLGAFLVSTLNIIQNSLLNQVEFVGEENDSNTILFDIQPNQKEGVIKLVKEHSLPINQTVPIVSTRLLSLKGKLIETIQKDTLDSIPNWALTREYRVTYRDSLTHSEELVEGNIHHIEDSTIYVTISEGMHENLNLEIGDRVAFDVQGVPILTTISGIRNVEWPKDPPNFIFVFPLGILEEAPQIYVVTTKINNDIKAASFQRELVAAFPNVSAIDLRLILNTINEFFDKVSFIIRFLAFFSIITGLVVLAGAVINSKYLRLKENVLLRTIGAMKKQIVYITLIEYGYLGLFSGFTGILLSIISSWVLTKYFFEINFFLDYIGLVTIWLMVVVLPMIVGWWNTRDIVKSSPLEVLRKE